MCILRAVIFTTAVICCFATEHNAEEIDLPKGIPREVYCTGCELTVKVMNNELSYHTGTDLNERIGNVMDTKKTCVKKFFDVHEVNVDKLLTICKHLLEKYSSQMHPFLYNYYDGKSRLGDSFYCLAHKICSHATPACKGIVNEEGAAEMECDQSDEDFIRQFEKKSKKANPVHESVIRDKINLHEEL